MARMKLKMTYHIRSLGGPWSITYFEVNGVPVGSIRTRSKEERDSYIKKQLSMNQDQLSKLLQTRIRSLSRGFDDVRQVLDNLEQMSMELLDRLK